MHWSSIVCFCLLQRNWHTVIGPSLNWPFRTLHDGKAMLIVPSIWRFYCSVVDLGFSPFIGISFRIYFDFLFTAEEEGGSRHLHSVFVRQSRDMRFGLHAPAPVEEIGLKEGPTCQVKWDTGVSPLSSLPLRSARHWRSPFNRISSDFLTDLANCLCIFVRALHLWSSFILLCAYCSQTRG